MIESGSFLSTGFATKIVDFENRTASIIIGKVERIGNGIGSTIIDRQNETSLSDEELSYAISLANKIWNPPPRSISPLRPPHICPDGFFSFTLLDGAAVLPILDSCGFRNNSDRADEVAFETWLDSVLRRAQPVQSKTFRLGALVMSFPGPPVGWGENVIVDIIGLVDAIDDATVTVDLDNGRGIAMVGIAPTTRYVREKPASASEIKPDDVITSAATLGADGKLRSIELQIIPEPLRGSIQGQYSKKDTPNQIMTTGTVTRNIAAIGSSHIELKFEGNTTVRMGGIEPELILDPGVPVTALVLIDKADIRPGLKVRVQGVNTTGNPIASRITLQ